MRRALVWAQQLLRADAFQLSMLLIAVIRGVGYCIGLVPSSAAEQALPQPLRVLCLAELALSAAVVITARLRESIEWERPGLKALGPSAFAYGLILASVSTIHGIVNVVVYMSLAWACWSRVWTIRRREHLIERVLEQGRE